MRRFVPVLVASLCFSACDASGNAVEGTSSLSNPSVDYAAKYADTAPTFDAQLNAVSVEHPGFKGIVGSEDGSEVVVLVAESAVQARVTSPHGGLASALSDRLGLDRGALTFTQPVTAQARGVFGGATSVAERPDFHVLYEVKTGLRRFLFETDLINHLDIDETTGRVVVGTASTGDAAQVRARMTPEELAVTEFALTQPFRNAVGRAEPATAAMQAAASHTNRSLRTSAFRPLIAGAQTEFRTQAGSQGSACTQGPAVRYEPGNLYGFLTNSHCTLDRDNVTNVRFFQPRAVLSDFLGHEIAEPLYRKIWGGAWTTSGFYADVAFVRTQQGMGLRGQMTSADYCGASADCVENGVITDITGTASYLAVNTPVFKTGKTTGTTAGLITKTCSDAVDVNNVRYLCQSIVGRASGSPTGQTLANGGDSGAPVLIRSGLPGTNQGMLAGIMWSVNDQTGEFAFSPWENIWQGERAGTKYGLPVQVVTSSQGVVSNTAYISPGSAPPTSTGGGGNPGGEYPGDECPPGPPDTWTPTRDEEPC